MYSNTTPDDGGRLYLSSSDATLDNNLIADNQAGTGGFGAGLYVTRASSRLRHNTIARNTGGAGSGVYVRGDYGTYSTVAMTNTILVNHTVGNTATLEATLWYGNGDYHILETSAAKDAGVDTGVTTDIDGQGRPSEAGYDIGADEFNLSPWRMPARTRRWTPRQRSPWTDRAAATPTTVIRWPTAGCRPAARR